jgi:hypothetical protein
MAHEDEATQPEQVHVAAIGEASNSTRADVDPCMSETELHGSAGLSAIQPRHPENVKDSRAHRKRKGVHVLTTF